MIHCDKESSYSRGNAKRQRYNYYENVQILREFFFLIVLDPKVIKVFLNAVYCSSLADTNSININIQKMYIKWIITWFIESTAYSDGTTLWLSTQEANIVQGNKKAWNPDLRSTWLKKRYLCNIWTSCRFYCCI